jgi:hypothetical protein
VISSKTVRKESDYGGSKKQIGCKIEDDDIKIEFLKPPGENSSIPNRV